VFGDDGPSKPFSVQQDRWRRRGGESINILERPEFAHLTDKLRAFTVLDRVVVITQGAKPFQVGKGNPPQTRAVVDNKPFVSTNKKDKTFRPLLRGSLMQRYQILWNRNYWISFGDWLAEPRHSAGYDAPEKIVIRQTGDSLVAALDNQQFIVRDNLYTIVPRDGRTDLRFILGLLNSRLLNWFYQKALNPEEGEALAQVKRGHLARLPIACTNKTGENHLVKLVDRIIATKRKNPAADTSALEREIDEAVYALYGLTPEEIKIVEGAVS
jgi:adenine-specific DNA-methyltransferase